MSQNQSLLNIIINNQQSYNFSENFNQLINAEKKVLLDKILIMLRNLISAGEEEVGLVSSDISDWDALFAFLSVANFINYFIVSNELEDCIQMTTEEVFEFCYIKFIKVLK